MQNPGPVREIGAEKVHARGAGHLLAADPPSGCRSRHQKGQARSSPHLAIQGGRSPAGHGTPVLEKNPKAWGQTAIATNNLGVARAQGSDDDARRLFLRALAIVEQQMGWISDLVRTLNNLASLAACRSSRGQRDCGAASTSLAGPSTRFIRRSSPARRLLPVGKVTGQNAARSTRSKDSSRRNGIGAVIDIDSLRQK